MAAEAQDAWTCEALQSCSKQPGGFEGLGKSQRRRAWLWLLGLEHLEQVLVELDGDDDESQDALNGHDAQASWSQVSSGSRDIRDSRDTSTSSINAGRDSELIASTSSIPLDNDGWQIAGTALDPHAKHASSDGDSSDENEGDLDANLVRDTTKPKSVDHWTTALSRRKARRRRLKNRSASLEAERIDSATAEESTAGHDRKKEHYATRLAEKRARRKHRRRKRHRAESDARDTLPAPDVPATSHRDEQQVALDVRRSFIELGDTPIRRRRREQLSYVICGVLRRHPSLNYYQGYHDVVSIVLAVLLPNATHVVDKSDGNVGSPSDKDALDAVIEVVARLSLHVLRDGMARDMTPTLGHLKLLRAIIVHCSAPRIAKIIDNAGPLPYFALPWLLSLFAHDVSPDIACYIFDYIIARGPVSTLCLAAALIEIVPNVDDEQDPAELHQTLSQLLDTVDKDTLLPLFERADEIARQTGLAMTGQDSRTAAKTTPPAFGRQIMGPQSVLYTWRNVPRPGGNADDALPALWLKADKAAAEALSGDVSAIVTNALPTPPPSPSPSDDRQRLSRKKRKTTGANAESHASARLAVLGAVGAVGMAMLLYYSGGGAASSQAGSSFGSNVLGRDAAVALLRSSDALRQVFRHALQ